MPRLTSFLLVISAALVCCTDEEQQNPYGHHGEPMIEVQKIFSNERLPNVVVTKDGSIVAVWGWGNVRALQSEDGGESWSEEMKIRETF